MCIRESSYDADPRIAQTLLEQVLADHDGILTDPAPQVLFWEFADSAMQFRVYYHVDISRISGLKVRDQVMLAIWERFREAGISIPFPQRDLHIKGGSVFDILPALKDADSSQVD